MPAQLNFFDKIGGLEGRVIDAVNYDVTEDLLRKIGGYPGAYEDAKQIRYALQQLKTPHEIGMLQNPAEYLATPKGALIAKSDLDFQVRLAHMSFRELFNELTRLGYKSSTGIRRIHHTEGSNRYSTARGELQKRLTIIETYFPKAASSFRNSFMDLLRVSNAEAPEHFDFVDYNIDDAKKNSIELYRRAIFKHVSAAYTVGKRHSQ